MKKVIYISGPVTNNPFFRTHFRETERYLKFKYPEAKIINPVKFEKEGKLWSYYLKKDIKKLLKCTTIYLMSGWKLSKGCQLEVKIAKDLGYEFIGDTDNVWSR